MEAKSHRGSTPPTVPSRAQELWVNLYNAHCRCHAELRHTCRTLTICTDVNYQLAELCTFGRTLLNPCVQQLKFRACNFREATVYLESIDKQQCHPDLKISIPLWRFIPDLGPEDRLSAEAAARALGVEVTFILLWTGESWKCDLS